METQSSPRSVIERLQTAQNQHDLEAFLACITGQNHRRGIVNEPRIAVGAASRLAGQVIRADGGASLMNSEVAPEIQLG